ncbi:MAG: hypothetical protein CL833_10505 [Crocinitomicaceae bacterium]|nr:hypothetical protein [Crocinitomicaceae bacterium]
MLKSALLLINIIGFILFPFLYIQDVSVDHKLPSQINAGDDVIVELVLSKPNVSGPARLKLDFSNAPNLTATELESAGASFTFKDNAALFIWYSIPADEAISLKYKLSAAEGTSGAQSILGSFSFVDGNDRRKVEIPVSVIDIKGEELSSNTNDEVVVIDSNEGADSTENIPTVTASRTIEASEDDFLVTVNIDKSNGEGFARLKEVVPNGFSAESVDAAGAVFSYKDNIAKFLWSSISTDNPVVVSYKLIPEEPTERGTYAVEGSFSAEFMVVDDVPIKAAVPMTSFIFEKGSLASNESTDTTTDNTTTDNTTTDNTTTDNTTTVSTTIDNTTTDNTTTDNTTTDNTTTDNTTADNTTTDNTTTDNTTTDNTTADNTTADNTTTDNTTSDNTTTDNPRGNSTGISFKVQIVASHKSVSESYINKHYGINESIALESHEGWVKYTVGGYAEYRSARDKRQKLSPYDLPGPFVTAYNSGERITVQEALMVANQDWVK